MYTAIACATNHPDAFHPYRGLFNHRIIKSLTDAGTALDIVSPRPFAPPVGPYSEYSCIPETEKWGTYTLHHPRFFYVLPKRYFYGLSGRSFSKRVSEYLSDTFEDPDVVHACHVYLDGYGVLPYCREHNVPLFVVLHGAFLNQFDQWPSGVQDKIHETLKASYSVLCVSNALAEKAKNYVSESKVKVVPIGADPENFPVERKNELRRELGISSTATVVLFVGQFNSRKGVPEIIKLLPQLDIPDLEFIFVGNGGELRYELTKAVAESQYSNQFLQWQITTLALRRWFAIADLLLLPSHSEGRPTVIYEAMASKTAVLGTTVGGIPEQVINGETGLLVSPGDVHALKDALTSIVGDSDSLREMGEKGYERLLEQDWTWSGHAERVQKLHSEAIR